MALPDPAKVALVKAIAVNGSQGPAALQAQQAPPPGAAAALTAASDRAGLIGAPSDFLAQQAAKISEPYATSATQNAANTSALNSYLGSMNAAHGNYMSELSAAAPLAQAQVDKAQQGNNLNDMLRLISLKGQMEDRDWTKQQHQAALDAQNQAKGDALTQHAGFNSILNNGDKNFRLTGIDIINKSKDLPSALYALDVAAKSDDIKSNPFDVEAMRRSLIQYYDPTTFAQLPPPAAAPAPAAASKGKPWYSGLFDHVPHLPGMVRGL